MENEPEIRDILLKMLELQQKQYEQHKASTALYRELAARQKKVLAGAGCLLVAILGLGIVWILLAMALGPTSSRSLRFRPTRRTITTIRAAGTNGALQFFQRVVRV